MAEKKIEKKIAHMGALVDVFRDVERETNELVNEENLSKEKLNKITVLYNTLKSKLADVNKINEQLIELINDPEHLKKAIKENTLFEISANETINATERFLNDNKEEKLKKDIKTSLKNHNVKLPKLIIKTFNGNVLEWNAFFDSFKAAVHDSDNLSNVEKFNYLRGYLAGQALKAIEGLTLTNDNYEKALSLLEERFGKNELIISKHMNDLLNLKAVTSERDIKGLRTLYDSVESHIRSLLSLKVDSKSYGTLLAPIIMEKLPHQVRLVLGRDLKGEGWDLTKLQLILSNELSIRESCIDSLKIKSSHHEFSDERPYSASALLSKNSKVKCVFCSQEHYSDKCMNLTDVELRKEFLQKAGKCFSCLKSGHLSRNCTSTKRCFYCKENHNSALCRNRKEKTNDKTQNLLTETDNSILLQTAVVNVYNKVNSSSVKARVIFDSGSQKSYVTRKIKRQLNLETIHKESLELSTFGKETTSTKQVDQVEISLSGVSKGSEAKRFSVDAFVVENICAPLSNFDITPCRNKYDHFKNLDFAETGEGVGNVDILVGCDFYWDFFSGKVIRGNTGPVAFESKFGWVLSGPVITESKGNLSSFNGLANITQSHVLRIHTESTQNNIENELHKFWDLETLGIVQNEKSNYESYLEDINMTKEGRYEVKLPFKQDHPIVSDNYNLCEKRLKTKLKTLKQTPNLLERYDAIFKEQEKLGIIEKVNESGQFGQTSYLPHHPVIKEDRETTKIRAVFDATAKPSGGTSLNDCLHKGPQLTPLIFDILLRFRTFPIALTADIEKAFLQISITEEERDFLRFLWVDDILKDEPVITRNRFARLVFGVTSSPFLLNGTIRKHVEKFKTIDIEFVKKVLDSFYVDDFISGDNTEKEVMNLLKKLKFRFLEGQFNLRKWRTNSEALRKLIDIIEDNENKIRQPAKVLGILWDEINDLFIIDLKNIVKNSLELKPTKRNILSVLCSFYDPIGFIQPLIVTMKLLFQQICRLKIDWDDELPIEISETWKNILIDMNELSTIEISRPYISNQKEDPVIEYHLHSFSDASPQAYGACVYLVAKTSSGNIKSSFITSKSRVSPMISPTLPRTELLGNLLAARLVNTVKNAIHIKFSKTFCWTDSKICLAWIQSKKEFKPFVENRVREIREKTSTDDWYYIPSASNPADFLTRKTKSPSEFLSSKMWWNGPSEITSKETFYPSEIDNEIFESSNFTDEIKVKTTNCLTVNTFSLNLVIDAERYSSYKKLIRVTAWVLRFISNIKAKLQKKSLTSSSLSAEEFRSAEELWIRENQKSFDNFDNLSHQLNVKQDENGIYRCYGRLENAPLPYQERAPILLNHTYMTELIIRDIHNRNKHCWTKQTLNELRQKFWITKGRQYVRKILLSCRICRKHNGKHYDYPITPPLTTLRLNDTRPFTVTGVDLCGPLFAKNVYRSGRVEHLYKCWVVLYTCAASRGIILDLVPDPKASSFLRSLSRFISRRGCPDDIITDNGTNFTAEETRDVSSHLNIDWHFNIPLAPWYGGFFERIVRSVKFYLRKHLGTARLTYEEIQTLLSEIEMIINNRPLTYLYPCEIEQCLTPNHLLFGHRLEQFSLINRDNVNVTSEINILTEKLNNVLVHFWNRWRHEYLAELREQHRLKTKSKQPEIQINDIVLVHEEKQPRSSWRIARVELLIESKDNKVRGAVVRLPNSLALKRPVNKLYPIEYFELKNEIESKIELKNNKKDEIELKKRPVRIASKTSRIKSKMMLENL